MGMDGAFYFKLITCFLKTSFTVNARIRAAARFLVLVVESTRGVVTVFHSSEFRPRHASFSAD